MAIQGSGAIESSIFLDNRVAVVADYVSIEGGWICMVQSDHVSDFIEAGNADVNVHNVWFGAPPQNLSLIRGFIKDVYWSTTAGRVILTDLPTQPTEWPPTLQRFHASLADRCMLPPNRGLDLSHPPSGVLFGDIVWPGAGSVTEVSTGIIITQQGSLTIEAGAVIRFVAPSAALIVKGSLFARGQRGAMITFEGYRSPDNPQPLITNGLQIAGSAPRVNISFANFTYFNNAINQNYPGVNSEWIFEDCLFQHNSFAVSGPGSYLGKVRYIRCEFSYNSVGALGEYHYLDSCIFHDQPAGAQVGMSFVKNCVFANHSGTALTSFDSSSITDSFFLSNDIALDSGSSVVTKCTISGNRVGIFAVAVDISDSNVCQNQEFNFIVESDQDLVISRVWLGTGSGFSARRSILSSPKSQIILNSARSRPFHSPTIHSEWLFGPSSPFSCLSAPCNPRETCGGRGVCKADGKCLCMLGWSGENCEECAIGNNRTICLPECENFHNCEACGVRPDCVFRAGNFTAGTGLCSAVVPNNSNISGIPTGFSWSFDCPCASVRF